jgi:hypothetical protein
LSGSGLANGQRTLGDVQPSQSNTVSDCVVPPRILDAAIRALRRLAVRRRFWQEDEFDLLGLGRARRTEQ